MKRKLLATFIIYIILAGIIIGWGATGSPKTLLQGTWFSRMQAKSNLREQGVYILVELFIILY